MPWNLRRDFHIDINAAYGSFLITSATDSSLRQPPPDMIEGDAMPVRLHFWERGLTGSITAADPGPDTVFVFSGRPAGAPAGSSLLFLTNDFIEVGAGVWEGTLDINTAELTAHLLDAASGSKIILGEIEVRDSISNTRRNSFQFDLTARRQVYQAEDATPTPLPSPIGDSAPVNEVPSSGRMVIFGSPNNAYNGVWEVGPYLGFKPSYYYESHSLYWNSSEGYWHFLPMVVGFDGFASASDVATPDLATDWFRVSDSSPRPSFSVTAEPGGTPATVAPPHIRVAGGFLYVQDSGVWKKVALSAL